jgi:hypothetical protein
VIVELGDSTVEITPVGNSVKLKTPRGNTTCKNAKIVVRDIFSAEEKLPEVVIHRVVYVY